MKTHPHIRLEPHQLAAAIFGMATGAHVPRTARKRVRKTAKVTLAVRPNVP